MLKLSNVSKFYRSKNSVSSGIHKINVEFNMGEFVAITGESGSGKSTLLNVISGLDTYEEGEMYINNKETSGYTEKNFEQYRKNYIGNIFQDFNLVNTYTVYQNIELVLLLSGFSKRKIKKKILDVIDKVGLSKYRRTKVSKLSGGQKQRVAIARALVRNTPIIVADEPTGNLDSKSATDVMKLLHEIAKDKLVIIVTHNYEQIEPYATRKITMHDGRIIEDKKLKEVETERRIKETNNKSITFINKVRLGFRNTFNVFPKFILLLLVFLFINVSIISGYTSIIKQEKENAKLGYSSYFRDLSDKRLIIQKKDKSKITDADYKKILNLSNVDKIEKNDVSVDATYVMSFDRSGCMGTVSSIKNLGEEKIVKGRKPKNDYETIVCAQRDSYLFKQDIINSTLEIHNNYTMETLETEKPIKIVGFVYSDDNPNYPKFYISDKVLNILQRGTNVNYSETSVKFQNSILSYIRVAPNKLVPKGNAYVPETFNYMCDYGVSRNKPVEIKVKNMYFSTSKKIRVAKTYNNKNYKTVLGIKNYLENVVYMNEDEYYSLYDKGNYQSSVFVKDEILKQDTISELENLNYKVLDVGKTRISYNGEYAKIQTFIQYMIAVIILIGILIISYFVIKIILKSRNAYYSTLRILGATRRNIKQIIKMELFIVSNIAYIITVIGVWILQKYNMTVNEFMRYLHLNNYIILYLVITIISIIIAMKYSKQIFKKSAMETYREEV